ncbi:MAG: T9SS type A sorting domain-containing protein [Bacteroidetes bacterium]|nr:T9SS type A sorting domain-containing protein [Bacteroidota bacterium]
MQQRGKFKPAITGENQYFRILFVFAEFEGNTYSSPSWPLNSLPAWANDLIDPIPDSYRPLTFSKFWDTMSMGQYDVIGDVYPTIVKVKSEDYYDTGGFNFTESNRDVFKALDHDPSVNWARYDNWKYNSSTDAFEFLAGAADNTVDMIFVIYRNSRSMPDGSAGWFTSKTGYRNNVWFNVGHFAGIASLGEGPFPTIYTTDDGKNINATYSTLGSGITIRNAINYSSAFQINDLLAHELGHYLLGEHIFNSYGMMSVYPELRDGQLSSIEREKLGYLSFIYQTQLTQTFPLPDVLTTGYVLKVPFPLTVPGGYPNYDSDKYFLIENHQRVSPFNQIAKPGGSANPAGTMGKGLYVFLVRYSDNLIKNADGSFHWSNPEGDTYIGTVKVPLLTKTAVWRDACFGDRNWNDFRYNPGSDYGYAPFHVKNPLTKQWELTWACYGDDKDAFNLHGTKIFTPWSNPSSAVSINEPTGYSFEITNQSTQSTSIKFYIDPNDGLALAPSKPQLFKLSSENMSPRLNWSPNIEPDMKDYRIYKAVTTGTVPTSWTLVATVSKTLSTYLDEAVTAGNLTESKKIFYTIKARDTQLKESEFSDYDWLYYNPQIQKITNSNGDESDLITSFRITKAFPNPFNPTSTIEFTLPESGNVSYELVDIEGRIVVSSNQNSYPVGRNTLSVIGSQLSSGMYLIRLTFKNQIQTHKLYLLK